MIYDLVKGLSKITTSSKKILPDIIMLDFTVVKAYMVDLGDTSGWVLVDTGLENSYETIIKEANEHFGIESKPKAIILTHGHFDHVGSVIKLSEYWSVNVYAHELELPYLTGKEDYREGDPTVDEGFIAKISSVFPHQSINLGNRVAPLSSDGYIPKMEGWRWIHTPGHSKGHISLFREADKILVVGDAFTTVKQESLLSVLSAKDNVKGPPAYMTTDWEAAKRSIEKLKNLYPAIALPSHGDVLKGEELAKHLQHLINHFKEEAVPDKGKYINK